MSRAMLSGGAAGRALTASSGTDGVYIPLAAVVVIGIFLGLILMGCVGAVLYWLCVLRRPKDQPRADTQCGAQNSTEKIAASGLTGTSALSVQHMGKSTHLNELWSVQKGPALTHWREGARTGSKMDGEMVTSSTTHSPRASSPSGMGALEDYDADPTLSNMQDLRLAYAEGTAAAQVLWDELDAMHERKDPLAGFYELLAPEQRRTGSHGVVQFAKLPDSVDTVALKFFIDRQAFSMEKQISTSPFLQGAVMQTHFAANADETCCLPSGYVFPPYTVTETCKSLDNQMVDAPHELKPVETISQVLNVLNALHKGGYAHRNIKPSNILQAPRQEEWILTDYAACAAIGAKAPPISHPSRLCYCAPEAVANLALLPQHQKPVLVTAAADIWAVGLIAYELLTRERVFQQGASPEQVVLQIGGGMPWEASFQGSESRNNRLGRRRRLVLACLDRDPSKRPSLDVLMAHWVHTPGSQSP